MFQEHCLALILIFYLALNIACYGAKLGRKKLVTVKYFSKLGSKLIDRGVHCANEILLAIKSRVNDVIERCQ